jgi:hypothetical protein
MSDEFSIHSKFLASNLVAEHDRYRRALEDIADMRPDGKIADFHFWGRAEDREESMKKRAREALEPPKEK